MKYRVRSLGMRKKAQPDMNTNPIPTIPESTGQVEEGETANVKKRKSTKTKEPKSTKSTTDTDTLPKTKKAKQTKTKTKALSPTPPPILRSDEYDELDSDEMDELEIDDLLPSSPVRQFRISPSRDPSASASTSTSTSVVPPKAPAPKSVKKSKKRKSEILDSSALDEPSAPDHLRSLASLPLPTSTSASTSDLNPNPDPATPLVGETPVGKKAKKTKAPTWCTSTPPVRNSTPESGSTSKRIKKGKDETPKPKKGPLVRLGASWATSTPPARQ